MLDFDVNIYYPSRTSNDRFVFENENEDTMSGLASTLTSVTKNSWEENIGFNLSLTFSVPLSNDQCLNSRSNVVFCKYINLRRQISMFIGSIGSCNVSSEPFSIIDIDKLFF